MENIPLHAQKVTILSRLIKESSLTLEEALLLLKEEEVEQAPAFIPSTTTPWTITNPYIYPSGTISFSSGSTGTLVSGTSNFVINNQTETDLNN